MFRKNLITMAISVMLVGMISLSMVPLESQGLVDYGECVGTQGGVPGNRQNIGSASPGDDASGIGSVLDAADGTTGDNVDGSTYQMAFCKEEAVDFKGASKADGEPEPISNPSGKSFVMTNTGWMSTWQYNEDMTVTIDKWRTSALGGYFASVTGAPPSPAPYFFPDAQLYKIPDVSADGSSGDGVLTWTGLPTSSGILGFVVYRADMNYTANQGWGSSYDAWIPVSNGADDGTTIINNSQSSPAVSTSDAYVTNDGEVSHTFTDSSVTAGNSYYYALTVIVAGSNGTTWNIESLYRGRGSNQVTIVSGASNIDIELRSDTGLQVICIPGDSLGSVNTALTLASSIEDATDMQVVYISDFEKGWNDFIYRDSLGASLSQFHTSTNYNLELGEGYMVSLLSPGSPSDTTWESPWEDSTSAKTVNLDAGWNNVGLPYDAANNYNTPSDLVDGVNINQAAAWVGNDWEVAGGTGWMNAGEIELQQAGSVSQAFDPEGNAHGFFVRSLDTFAWDQGSAL